MAKKKTKVCIKCGKRKPLSEYSKHKSHKDGHRSDCRACCKKYMKAWEERNPYRRYKFKALGKSMMRLFTNTLIGEGMITVPDACEVCGAKVRLHPHHNTYFDPFDIIFVCPKCHNKIHSDDTD